MEGEKTFLITVAAGKDIHLTDAIAIALNARWTNVMAHIETYYLV